MKLTTFFDKKVEEVILVITLVLMVALIFSQVSLRALSIGSLTFGDELSRYLHILQVWIGASLAIRKGEHIRITFFVNLFSGRMKMALDLLAIISWFAFALFIAVEGTSFINGIFHSGQTSPSMGIPMWIPYISIPLGGLLMSIRLIQQIFLIVKNQPEDKELV